MRGWRSMATRTASGRLRKMAASSIHTRCFSVLLRWLLERKKWPGDVVRAFNTTGMVDRIAAKYGRKLNECPIGFKYIADLMMEHEILIGGEESGGIGYSRFLPERDGLLNACFWPTLWPRKASRSGNWSRICSGNIGPHYYGRRDLHITEELKQRRHPAGTF